MTLGPEMVSFALAVLARQREVTTSTLCPACGYRVQTSRSGHCADCTPARRRVAA